jgi:threonine/homoserine/homoserine lactone efflux protein
MKDPLLFTLTVLAILVTPGPTNTLLLTAGAANGMRRAYVLIPAEALGYFVAIQILRLILGTLVESVPMLVVALRIVVGSYLLWVAGRLWSQGRRPMTEGQKVITADQIFVTTLLNPKAIILALGIIPIGVPHVLLYLIAFQAFAAVVATLWIAGGAALGRMAQDRSGVRFVPRIGAVVLGVFAITLMVSPLMH